MATPHFFTLLFQHARPCLNTLRFFEELRDKIQLADKNFWNSACWFWCFEDVDNQVNINLVNLLRLVCQKDIICDVVVIREGIFSKLENIEFAEFN
jgi:hypothetical protein